MNRFRSTFNFALSLALCVGFVPHAYSQTKVLSKEVIAANRELDQRLMAAHALKDAAMVQSLFSVSPDVFFIDPTGHMTKGSSSIRHEWATWFDTLETIRGDIQDISYIPAGEGVIGVGTVIYTRKPKNAPADQKTVIWTDYRRIENGKWVYLFRHAHWPLHDRNPRKAP